MKLLVPIDFSGSSLLAVEVALALATKGQDSLSLVHVLEPVYDFASQASLTLAKEKKESHTRAKKILHSYSAKGIPMEYIQEEGNPGLKIAQLAKEREVDLIVMGTHGARGVQKTLAGTVAIRVIREANCPVFVVPETASLTGLKKFVLALSYADHEPMGIEWMVQRIIQWQGSLRILHIQAPGEVAFREEIMGLGMEQYLARKYPNLQVTVEQLPAQKITEGLISYMNQQEESVLVMCRAQPTSWEELFKKSQSLEMAFKAPLPLLILR